MPVLKFDGEEIELPKLTLSMQENMDKAIKAPSDTRAGLETKLKFVREVLPEEMVNEALDGATVADIDISALSMMVESINAAYTAPLIEARMEQLAQMMEPLQGMAGSLEMLANLEPNRAMRRAGFKSVK